MTVFWDDVIVLSMIVSVDVLLFFLKKEQNYCNVTFVFYLGHELLKKYIILLKNNSALIWVFVVVVFLFCFVLGFLWGFFFTFEAL